MEFRHFRPGPKDFETQAKPLSLGILTQGAQDCPL